MDCLNCKHCIPGHPEKRSGHVCELKNHICMLNEDSTSGVKIIGKYVTRGKQCEAVVSDCEHMEKIDK